jgi:hypothetical protein
LVVFGNVDPIVGAFGAGNEIVIGGVVGNLEEVVTVVGVVDKNSSLLEDIEFDFVNLGFEDLAFDF